MPWEHCRSHRRAHITARRCPSPGEMVAPVNTNSPGRVSAYFDDSTACAPPPPSPCGGDDCRCSCCTAAGCLDASEGTFTSGDGASCSQAECAERFFQCPDPASLGTADSNTATVLDATPCVYPPPPPPCGSDDCTCSCCSGDGCPALTIPELPINLFRAGLAAARQHGQRALARSSSPCGHPPLQKPTRLLRAALWVREERPCRLDAEERLRRCAPVPVQRRRFHRR